jgi:hypothetical protein
MSTQCQPESVRGARGPAWTTGAIQATRAHATCGVDSVGGRLRDSPHKAVFCEQIVGATTRYKTGRSNSASDIETNTNQYWAIS